MVWSVRAGKPPAQACREALLSRAGGSITALGQQVATLTMGGDRHGGNDGYTEGDNDEHRDDEQGHTHSVIDDRP